MITKEQVIRETYEYYSADPNGRRSLGEHGECLYNGPDGKKCAFARCCNKVPEKFENFAFPSVHYIATKQEEEKIKGLISCLKEEYKHINDVNFWHHVQQFHDMSNNWDYLNNKISERGEKRYAELLEKYKEI